jgi:molecular chaperone GrpE
VAQDLAKMGQKEGRMENNEKSAEPGNQDHGHEEMVDLGSKENSSEPKSENVQEHAGNEGDVIARMNELNDKYIRLYSEFDNYRKRSQKEKSELAKWASEDLMKAILPVIDDFERGLKSLQEASDINALKEGVELIYGKMKRILEQKGLEAMVSNGEAFNPDLHEAITQIAGEEEKKGKVIDEVEKGYLLGGKVIRYAKVVVGS